MKSSSFGSYKTFFRAFSNKTKFDIMKLLTKGPMSVSEICKATGFEQSRVSHNLKKLECYKFVSCKRKGKNIIYEINQSIIGVLKSADKYMISFDKKLKDCK